MRKFVLAAFVLASGPAFAGSYDDFSQGVTALTEGRSNDLVIADFSRAIAAGDLAPSLQPTAYLDRGVAYLASGKCALAYADFDMSLKLRWGYLQTIMGRGNAEACLGRYDDAAADFTAAANTNPTAGIYRAIGSMHWMAGNFSLAETDFQKSLQLDPQAPYPLLWLGISRMRDDTFDAQSFAKYFSDMSVSDWPLPILRFYMGRITATEMAAEAAKGDAKDVPGHKCEADFYDGEWKLTHGDVGAGKAMFQDAVNICPKNFVEFGSARLELKRLQ